MCDHRRCSSAQAAAAGFWRPLFDQGERFGPDAGPTDAYNNRRSSLVRLTPIRRGREYLIHKCGPLWSESLAAGCFQEIAYPRENCADVLLADTNMRPTRSETLLTVTFANLGGRGLPDLLSI